MCPRTAPPGTDVAAGAPSGAAEEEDGRGSTGLLTQPDYRSGDERTMPLAF
jgi:hypothetical protein